MATTIPPHTPIVSHLHSYSTISLPSSSMASPLKLPNGNQDENSDKYTVRMNSLDRSGILKANNSRSFDNFSQFHIDKNIFPPISNTDQPPPPPPPNGLFFNFAPAPLDSSPTEPMKGEENNLSNSPPPPPPEKKMSVFGRMNVEILLKKILNNVSCRRYKRLEDRQLKLIGDLSVVRAKEENELKSQQGFIYIFLTEYVRFQTFNPYGAFKMSWDLFILFTMVFLFFSIPLVLSTQKNFEQLFGGGIPYYALGLTLVVDVLVNINTGYYLNG